MTIISPTSIILMVGAASWSAESLVVSSILLGVALILELGLAASDDV